jgi:hypothetical protein
MDPAGLGELAVENQTAQAAGLRQTVFYSVSRKFLREADGGFLVGE